MSKNIALRLAARLLGLIAFASALRAADAPKPAAALPAEGGRIVIETSAPPPPVPALFSARVEQGFTLGRAELVGEARVKFHIFQGRPEVLTLGLSGDGEVVDVTSAALRDWSVRKGAGGQRFLDLRLSLPAAPAPMPPELECVVISHVRRPVVPGQAALLLLTPGEAVGFSARTALRTDASVDFKVTTATGLTPVGDGSEDATQFLATGQGRLEVRLSQRGAAVAEAELAGASLHGTLNDAARSVDFRLRASLRATKAGARLWLLSGTAAPSTDTSGEGWHLELMPAGPGFAYDLVADKAGAFPLEIGFSAAIRESGNWRTLDFAMPAGAVVPLQLDGLPAGVSFKADAAVVPTAAGQSWRGFLPADGAVSLAWKNSREASEGTLFFTSTELSEVRIGAGLLRQSSVISFRVLQGKLGGVRCRLDGPGEILQVAGPNVIGWKVTAADAGRVLEVRFNRPVEADGTLRIDSQAELGSWPVRAEPLRLTPEGGVRHSGFVRVANEGAVRVEVADVTGMMQLAPAQFPGAPLNGARQIFVYRFPSATRDYRVLGSQISPEVGVAAVVTYELADTARVIAADLELDVREAPLRDWTLRIPEDYTVVALTGSEVTDYVVESVAAEGTRALRVLFAKAIEGRQLLQLRLEKNQPAGAGAWRLPALRFPEAKSVRGHVGAVATPGYRLVPGTAERLVEMPLSFFPRQTAGLQQAWRVREPDWAAELQVEALGQSVQADVFHLYSLRPGVVATSVLLNYYVVGAPASEWRVEVPASVGNIDVVGQNVRRDWRREGDQLVISLHQPVLGAATLLITFEQPMSARGGTIAPGVVRPLGVQAERGFVQVVSPMQVKHEIRKAEGGLLKLEPTELPAEFRPLTNAPSLAVYQYTARPFALEVGVEWYAPSETVEQVVDFAKLGSQVSRDGQVVTEARFFVKTRGQKALRLTLPADVKLWEVRVDNELVNARVDGGATLVPLPPKANPNDPVAVALRLGQSAGAGGRTLKLVAPQIGAAPVLVSDWTVRGDAGRQLVPRGGNAELVAGGLTEDGFEWISRRGALGTFALLLVVAMVPLLAQARTTGRLFLALLTAGLGVVLAGVLAMGALVFCRPNASEFTFATTMLSAGEVVSVQLDNLPEWLALVVPWGLASVVAGAAAIFTVRRSSLQRQVVAVPIQIGGVLLVALGLLAQHGGATLFFVAAAFFIFTRLLAPVHALLQRERREQGATPLRAPGAATASLLAAGLIVAGSLVAPAPLEAAEARRAPASPAAAKNAVETVYDLASRAAAAVLPEGTKPAQSTVQRWTLRGERLQAELDFTARGVTGDTFLLLRAPAVLTEFNGNGLRLSKVEREGQIAYYVSCERDGSATARVRFELPVPDRSRPLALPTGPAAAQRVTVELDQAGWEIASPAAVSAQPLTGLAEGRSGATLLLTPELAAVIQLRPLRRDLAAEKTTFFAETTNLFVPGPGVVNGLARVTVRPAQGRVAALEIAVPAGLTVGDVGRGPVGAWRFDPEKRRLHVSLEPAQSEAFAFVVETQVGAGDLPFALTLEPLRVLGAAGDVGLLALAFGGDAQPEGIKATGLSVVNIQDLDPALIARARETQPLATAQQAWRYGPEGGRVELRVAPVAPEVRVTGRQVLSLDDDRLVLAVDLRVAITRVGLFKLSFALPEGLEVEALTGPALNHWTDSQEGGQRMVTLHLNGRTFGEQAFNLTLAGAAPRAQGAWAFPRLLVREATRQTTEVLIVPGKGLQLRAVDRERVTQLDPRAIGGPQPGSLAFRLLQEDWVLRLGIEALDPWVTVQALQESTLREGQTLTRLALRYRVENAAVKQVRLRLPGLGEESVRTVRATGSAVSDIVRVPETPDTWEIRFQRGIAGETDVQIEYQGPAAREQGRETVTTPGFAGAQKVVQFVALRTGGRLELEAPALPRGWSRADWSSVPTVLQNRSDRGMPALCFRVAEPEGPLAITVRRHGIAEALKLRVTQGQLTTLFAPTGDFLTAVDLQVDVLEKSTLRVRLPAGARLFNTLVNGENVSVVREADAYLFHVVPSTTAQQATVRLVYSATGAAGRSVGLVGPSLSVPLENVTWRVIVPPGYDLSGYRGGLRLVEEQGARVFGLEDYISSVTSKRAAAAKEVTASMQQANAWLAMGEQEKAGAAFNSVLNSSTSDAASNEDARVQLRNLRTQQTLLGLNARRQRIYLDNAGNTGVVRNDLLEQAAGLNPLLQGKSNFNPKQLDQFMQGNSADETTALRGIATRIVDQQLGAEPVPSALDVTLAQRGQVMTFARALQVDGNAPLEIDLKIVRSTAVHTGLIAGLLLVVAGLTGFEVSRRKAVA